MVGKEAWSTVTIPDVRPSTISTPWSRGASAAKTSVTLQVCPKSTMEKACKHCEGKLRLSMMKTNMFILTC